MEDLNSEISIGSSSQPIRVDLVMKTSMVTLLAFWFGSVTPTLFVVNQKPI